MSGLWNGNVHNTALAFTIQKIIAKSHRIKKGVSIMSKPNIKLLNSVVIVAFDRSQHPRGIVGCVSKISVKNGRNRRCLIYYEINKDPRKAIHFDSQHSALMFANYMCANNNAQVDEVEFGICNYTDMLEKYEEAKKEGII